MTCEVVNFLDDVDDEIKAALIKYPILRPYYQLLLDMFPNTRKSDIKNFCLQNASFLVAEVKVRDQHLNKLVNELLSLEESIIPEMPMSKNYLVNPLML